MKGSFPLTLAVIGLLAIAAPKRGTASEATSPIPAGLTHELQVTFTLPAELEAARCWADPSSGPCRGNGLEPFSSVAFAGSASPHGAWRRNSSGY